MSSLPDDRLAARDGIASNSGGFYIGVRLGFHF
jgi:hypothetical protein